MNIDQGQVGQDQGRRWFPVLRVRYWDVLSQNLQLWPTSFWACRPKKPWCSQLSESNSSSETGHWNQTRSFGGQRALLVYSPAGCLEAALYTSDVKKEKQKEKSNNVEHTRLVLPHVLHSLFFLPTFNRGNCLSFLSVDVFYIDKRFDSSHLTYCAAATR